MILYDAMNQLIYEPGRFDSIARQLTQDLNAVIKGIHLILLINVVIYILKDSLRNDKGLLSREEAVRLHIFFMVLFPHGLKLSF